MYADTNQLRYKRNFSSEFYRATLLWLEYKIKPNQVNRQMELMPKRISPSTAVLRVGIVTVRSCFGLNLGDHFWLLEWIPIRVRRR